MSTTIPVPLDRTANGHEYFQGPLSPVLTKMLDHWQRGKLWHESAPRQLTEGWTGLETSAAWKRWTEYLASRKNVPLLETIGSKADPLDWGLPTGDSPLAGIADWRTAFDKSWRSPGGKASPSHLEAALAGLVSELELTPLTPATACRSVIVAYRLPALAQHLRPTVWWRVLAALLDLATETHAATGDELDPETTLVATLVAGEMPLVLSTVLPELKPLRSLRSMARKSLGEGLLAATDGEGVVDAALLPVLPVLFSSWTRARTLGEELKKGCWSGSAETQYEWLVRQTIRLQRPDGSLMLHRHAVGNWPAGALDTALDIAGDDQDDAAAAAHLAKVLPTIDSDYDEYELPEASVESEWSSLALLANGWDKSASRVLVDYSRPEIGIEIESAGRTLLSGGWETETRFNGKPLALEEEWEQQCWYSDDDCDFLDLVVELSGGARLERQLFLGKEDGFLLLHDILHAPEDQAGEWQHTMRLPLFADIHFLPEEETRDGSLVNGKGAPRASVLPLALAEWRVDPRFGELSAVDGALELAQHARSARLSCPLWFDLQPRRVGKPRTWRQLTVAESLEVAPSDVAVGYRVQCGDAQWLAYRSLAAPANRTVLGQNTAAEMFVSRFYRTGECDELLAVEPGE